MRKHHGMTEAEVTTLIVGGGADLISRTEAIGGLSLVFWALIFLTVKYDLFVLRADNHGEGGTFALWGLLKGYTGKIVGLGLIVALIKDSKKKAQASIQGDTVRIASKDRDVLQEVIALLRGKDLGIDLQFTNYRSN